MILIDANLLIYSVNADSKQHEMVRTWLDDLLSGDSLIGLPLVVLLAFIRITTRRGLFPNPLTCEEALARVDRWLSQPFVEIVQPGPRHWPILHDLLRTTGAAGNLTTDAHIAALSLELGATIASADHDFTRFPGIDHFDPLQPGSDPQ